MTFMNQAVNKIKQHRIKTALLTTLVASAFVSSAAIAAGDAAAGKGKSAVCATCHGPTGVAIAPMYPNLAGQNAAYLESSLKAYRKNERKGGMSAVMTPMAASLSDQDIADLAAYFSTQTLGKK
ncbi:c-type cytochrome [Marinibactrum halimedae]|uniref:Cytochrome c domain-containing protein n=1 Tax=Marinibactrum halimedae TaxID=1444977 RepID=A0AA37T487_9GAMM|nr:cytochrome c [Marinibactrum halimedae]MCD9457814.1 cytochrome c [Marinibactrum halimedae]GLS24812.1 hypothetical protein GCM10007877_05260 [Marinibactrum halimedae]